jgi:hypothetical protein
MVSVAAAGDVTLSNEERDREASHLRLIGLQRTVDDDDVGAPAAEDAAD